MSKASIVAGFHLAEILMLTVGSRNCRDRIRDLIARVKTISDGSARNFVHR